MIMSNVNDNVINLATSKVMIMKRKISRLVSNTVWCVDTL